MKILSESEIKKLYSEMMTKAEGLLDQIKEREYDNFLLHQDALEKQYQNELRKSKDETFLRSINFLCDLHAMDLLSESAIQKLSKIDISTSEGKDRACQIISRELYLDKRIDMECSHSEGYGVSPVLDGLFGEKLTVLEP